MVVICGSVYYPVVPFDLIWLIEFGKSVPPNKFWSNALRYFAISAKLLQASGDATGPAGVGQVLAQRQQGVVPKCGLLPLHGGHRERRTFGAAHSGLFDRNTNSPSAIWLHSDWRVLGSIPILFQKNALFWCVQCQLTKANDKICAVLPRAWKMLKISQTWGHKFTFILMNSKLWLDLYPIGHHLSEPWLEHCDIRIGYPLNSQLGILSGQL